jgi:hypothetical protein
LGSLQRLLYIGVFYHAIKKHRPPGNVSKRFAASWLVAALLLYQHIRQAARIINPLSRKHGER